ncbi:MAG: lipase family protein, partial [Melioribacteraceae bacterium]|nr:lipase family protein [Melioribacteraceae bacterium]
ERGSVVESQTIITFSAESINGLLAIGFTDFNPDFQAQYDVELVRIVYKTIDAKDEIVFASGVVGIPKKVGASPLISLHHGTQTKKNRVASQNVNDAYQSIIAASVGYVTSEPDYLGFGVSTGVHPYLHEKTSASCAIDMIRATKRYCEQKNISINSQLFLAGYSQGGYVTMATHKEIETNLTNEFQVTASAPMAGPHDLLGTAQFVLSDDEYPRPSFISFIAYAYNEVYEWNKLSEIFNAPYNSLIPQLYDGNSTTAEIDNQLPKSLRTLFSDSFIDGLRDGTLGYIVNAFEENSLLDWTPIAPITLIHGDADTYVPFSNASAAQASLLSNGATEVNLVPIVGGDHDTSVLPAIEYTLNWFSTFSSGNLAKINLSR